MLGCHRPDRAIKTAVSFVDIQTPLARLSDLQGSIMEDGCSKLATVYIIIYYYIFRALHTEYIYIYKQLPWPVGGREGMRVHLALI